MCGHRALALGADGVGRYIGQFILGAANGENLNSWDERKTRTKRGERTDNLWTFYPTTSVSISLQLNYFPPPFLLPTLQIHTKHFSLPLLRTNTIREEEQTRGMKRKVNSMDLIYEFHVRTGTGAIYPLPETRTEWGATKRFRRQSSHCCCCSTTTGAKHMVH